MHRNDTSVRSEWLYLSTSWVLPRKMVFLKYFIIYTSSEYPHSTFEKLLLYLYLLANFFWRLLLLSLITYLVLFKTIVHDFDTVALVLVRCLIALNLVLSIADSSFELLLLVVELVFQSQEMLVKRDSITEKRFIATCLVLLIDFLVFKQLDLSFHGRNLLVEIQNDVIMDQSCFTVFLLPAGELSDFISSLLQIGMTLEFLINDGSSCPLVHIVERWCIFNIAAGYAATLSSSCSAYRK